MQRFARNEMPESFGLPRHDDTTDCPMKNFGERALNTREKVLSHRNGKTAWFEIQFCIRRLSNHDQQRISDASHSETGRPNENYKRTPVDSRP